MGIFFSIESMWGWIGENIRGISFEQEVGKNFFHGLLVLLKASNLEFPLNLNLWKLQRRSFHDD